MVDKILTNMGATADGRPPDPNAASGTVPNKRVLTFGERQGKLCQEGVEKMNNSTSDSSNEYRSTDGSDAIMTKHTNTPGERGSSRGQRTSDYIIQPMNPHLDPQIHQI